jgi:hypothetical protein
MIPIGSDEEVSIETTTTSSIVIADEGIEEAQEQQSQRQSSSRQSQQEQISLSLPMTIPKTTSSTTSKANKDIIIKKSLSSNQNTVAYWRFVLLIVLLVSMISTVILIRKSSPRQEYNEFYRTYLNDGNTCLESIQHSLYDTLCSADYMIIN